MQFHGVIKKGTGKETVYRERDMRNYIASLGRDDKDVEITFDIGKRKRKRSRNANDFYWFCLSLVVERMLELGHEVDKDLMHEFFKGRFLYTEFLDETTGEILRIPRSTTEVSSDEFWAYLEEIKRFAAQTLSLVIPEPGEQIQIDI